MRLEVAVEAGLSLPSSTLMNNRLKRFPPTRTPPENQATKATASTMRLKDLLLLAGPKQFSRTVQAR